MSINDIVAMLRIKHYLKNVLIIMPVFFAHKVFDVPLLTQTLCGFAIFCFVSSVVYIINDLRDLEKDRLHPLKKNRPLASGRISKRTAFVFLSFLLLAACLVHLVFVKNGFSLIYILVYLGLNLAYSFGLKNVPVLDVIIVSTGYCLRVFYGGSLCDIPVSDWLYLVILTGSLYMCLGKRRNEMKEKDTRAVLERYNHSFLDKGMYVCLALVVVFYSLWAKDAENHMMMATIPGLFILLLRYSYDIEGNSDGDPIEVIFSDKILLILGTLFVLCIFTILYGGSLF